MESKEGGGVGGEKREGEGKGEIERKREEGKRGTVHVHVYGDVTTPFLTGPGKLWNQNTVESNFDKLQVRLEARHPVPHAQGWGGGALLSGCLGEHEMLSSDDIIYLGLYLFQFDLREDGREGGRIRRRREEIGRASCRERV